MRQEDFNDMMRNPGEGKHTPARSLPKCPSCGEPYLGDGVAPCLECAARAQEQRKHCAAIAAEKRGK